MAQKITVRQFFKSMITQDNGLLLLRYALAYVFLWFATQQLAEPSRWVFYLPQWTEVLPLTPEGFIMLNGWFELILGLLLLVGFQTRFVSILLSAHLLMIAISIGSEIGVRDMGLALATLSISFFKPDKHTVDAITKKPS